MFFIFFSYQTVLELSVRLYLLIVERFTDLDYS